MNRSNYPLNKIGDTSTELLGDETVVEAGIVDRVVQQPGSDDSRAGAELREQRRRLHAVLQVGIAARAHLSNQSRTQGNAVQPLGQLAIRNASASKRDSDSRHGPAPAPTWPRWAASAAAKALRTRSSRKMAYRDSAPASMSAGDESPPPPTPPTATAARARLADGPPRHVCARGSGGSAERERDRDGGLRHRADAARMSVAAGSSSAAAGCCGARRGLGRHLTVQVIDGGMACPAWAIGLGARGRLAGEGGAESGGRDGRRRRGVGGNGLGGWASSVSRVVGRL